MSLSVKHGNVGLTVVRSWGSADWVLARLVAVSNELGTTDGDPPTMSPSAIETERSGATLAAPLVTQPHFLYCLVFLSSCAQRILKRFELRPTATDLFRTVNGNVGRWRRKYGWLEGDYDFR